MSNKLQVLIGLYEGGRGGSAVTDEFDVLEVLERGHGYYGEACEQLHVFYILSTSVVPITKWNEAER